MVIKGKSVESLANCLERRRGWVMFAAVAITLLAFYGGSRLTVDDVPRNLFVSDDDESAALEEIYKQFGADDNDCVFVVESEDLFTPRSISALRHLIDAARRVEGVETVFSIADAVIFPADGPPHSLLPPNDAPPAAYDAARREGIAHPLIGGQLLSEDGRTTLVVARMDGHRISIGEMAPVVAGLRGVLHETVSHTDLKIRLTGIPIIRVEIYDLIPREQAKFMMVGALLGMLAGYAMLRRWSALFLVSFAGVSGAIWTFGAMGLVGEPVNLLNSILPSLVMTIGFTDAVHLLYDFTQSRRAGVGQRESAVTTIRHLGPACALTSLTTAIGFGSLAVAGVPIIRRLGITCAGGVTLTLAAVLILVPLLAGTRWAARMHDRPPSRIGRMLSGPAVAVMRWIIGRPRLVSLAGVAVTALLVMSAVRLTPNSSMRESLPSGMDSSTALLHCDEVFGGVSTASVLVEWREGLTVGSPEVLAAITEVEKALVATPRFHHPMSVLNLLHSLPGPGQTPADRVPLLAVVPRDLRERLVRDDLRRALVTARVPDDGTALMEPAVNTLAERLSSIDAAHPGVTTRLTGIPILATRQLNRMIRELAESLSIAAIAIFGVMTMALRSIRLGLLSVLPNVFPLAMTAAVVVWLGRHLELTSVIVFSVCLGIAVDDTIHFVMRYRRELAVDGDVNEAIIRAFRAVGRALVTTTAVLVCGFGAVLLSAMPTLRLFAGLACVAFASALVGDLLILPALLAWLGPRGKQKPGQRLVTNAV